MSLNRGRQSMQSKVQSNEYFLKNLLIWCKKIALKSRFKLCGLQGIPERKYNVVLATHVSLTAQIKPDCRSCSLFINLFLGPLNFFFFCFWQKLWLALKHFLIHKLSLDISASYQMRPCVHFSNSSLEDKYWFQYLCNNTLEADFFCMCSSG